MAVCSLCFTSCLSDLDNYESPNGGIKGQILDAETNEPIPLPVQGSTGVIINMFEQNTDATQSVDFYAKMDGSYENAKLFNCDYKIVVNGPFVSPCEEFVTVKGQTTLDLKATPYARINASAQVTGKKITITYKVNPTNSNFKVFASIVKNGGTVQVAISMYPKCTVTGILLRVLIMEMPTKQESRPLRSRKGRSFSIWKTIKPIRTICTKYKQMATKYMYVSVLKQKAQSTTVPL